MKEKKKKDINQKPVRTFFAPKAAKKGNGVFRASNPRSGAKAGACGTDAGAPSAAAEKDRGAYIVKTAELETVCGITSKLPDNALSEFAFAGKSNVGKSSLINALMQRKALARTSATPGKTQTINFYNVNGALYLVDLPGYGFTKANESVKAKWGQMVERYLKKSRQLKKVFLLVDMRHKPTDDDCMMYDWIVHNGYHPIVIATKQDKLRKNDLPKAKKCIRETLGMEDADVLIPFSAETKLGREEIYEILRAEGAEAEI